MHIINDGEYLKLIEDGTNQNVMIFYSFLTILQLVYILIECIDRHVTEIL